MRLREDFDAARGLFMPALEVLEQADNLTVRVAVPDDMTRDDITIAVTRGELTICGERHTALAFFRSVPLPDGVDADRLHTTLARGVLEILMPLRAALVAAAAMTALVR